MPRKRRISKPHSDQAMKRLLTNPFTALDEPWETSDFPWAEAKRVWRQIRDEANEQWTKRHPGWRPWPYWRFDQRIPEPPHDKQARWLQQHKLLTPYETRVLALRTQ